MMDEGSGSRFMDCLMIELCIFSDSFCSYYGKIDQLMIISLPHI